MANSRKRIKGNIMLSLDDQRTLLSIYESENIDPQETAIILALNGGMRVPVGRQYDNVSFENALKKIAELLRDQEPQKIYMGDILGDKSEMGNYIHHFELWPIARANKMAILYNLFSEDALIEMSLCLATFCKENEITQDIIYGIIDAYAQIKAPQVTNDITWGIVNASLNYFNTPAHPINLSELLTKPFDELPQEFQGGLIRFYCHSMNASSPEVAKNDWNDCTPQIKIQTLYAKLTNLGKYPLLISDEASDFYGLNNPSWKSALEEERKQILKKYAFDIGRKVGIGQNPLESKQNSFSEIFSSSTASTSTISAISDECEQDFHLVAPKAQAVVSNAILDEFLFQCSGDDTATRKVNAKKYIGKNGKNLITKLKSLNMSVEELIQIFYEFKRRAGEGLKASQKTSQTDFMFLREINQGGQYSGQYSDDASTYQWACKAFIVCIKILNPHFKEQIKQNHKNLILKVSESFPWISSVTSTSATTNSDAKASSFSVSQKKN